MTSRIQDIYPLAPLQQGILFHTAEAPAEATGAYWVQDVKEYVLDPMDPGALRRAWDLVLDRHPVLRTSFAWEGVPEALQVVHGGLTVPLEMLDWSDTDDTGQQGRLAELLTADRARGFDLRKPPLLRVHMIARGAHRYWMAWTFHHICLDGWSVAVVADEVRSAYESLARGEAPDLPPARPYRDFIHWLSGRKPAEAGGFWHDYLAGFDAPTPLPVDRAAVGHWALDTRRLVLPTELTRDLKATARRARVTLSTVVQAAWALLLSRYSGEDDVVFGMAVSGRPPELPGVESMVGLFINTLPLRARVPDDEPFSSWLRRLQDEQVALRRFEHTPLAEIQRSSAVPRGTSLFESIIAFQNLPDVKASETAGLDGEGTDGAADVDAFATLEEGRYPLMFSVDLLERLTVGVQFSTAAFDRETVERVLGQLRHALTAVAADPDIPVRDIPLNSAQERHRVLVDWNRTPLTAATNRGLAELFGEQVAATPDARAILCEGKELSYAELYRRSNQVARWLRRNGVEPRQRVGLYMERGVEYIIALLGVVEAGACYVPLVPGQPESRLRYMVENSASQVVVCAQDRPAGLGDLVTLLDISAADDGSAPEPLGAASRTGAGSSLYVMYTSGSTGTPKGVEVTHQGVVRLCRDQIVRILPGDVISHMVPISFDPSTFEIWAALLNGATLAIATAEEMDRIDIVSLLRRNEVTVAVITTGLFHQAAELAPEAFTGLRMLLVGGDAMLAGPARKVKQHLPALRVINAYGPTETTIACTMFDVDSGLPPGEGTVPIGGPLVGTRVYVLDKRLNVPPIGASGELFIGGVGLARGYTGRPDLTAERFVPDPVSGRPGARLYRTGDRVRWRADGVLEFLGRVDEQVKIRGFRIELGEVQSALAGHPRVREAVVVVHEDEIAGKRLAAYVVTDPPGASSPGDAAAGDGPTASELRAYLRGQLPEYMVPAMFTTVDAIPLTEHGKVDRGALPAPVPAADDSVQYVPPRTDVEATLTQIWSQVLSADRVGVHDNFFALGGDSMLSLQIVARARKAGLGLTVADVFERLTVAELAQVAKPAAPVAAEQGPVSGPVPLTPVQHWFLRHDVSERDHWNWSGMFELRAGTDPGALRQVVHALLAHHDALRMRLAYDPRREAWVQRNAADEETEVFAVVDAAGRGEEWVTGRMTAAHRSLNLADGPLLRVLYFDRGDDPDWLGIIVHHLVVDLLSWNVLLEDLHLGYEVLTATGSLDGALGPKTTSFKEWAERLAAFAESDEVKAELPYWQRRQAGSGFTVPLDLDGVNTEASSASVQVFLDADSTVALLTTVHHAYGTQANDVMVAALLHTLARWSGTETAAIDLENHGRQPIGEGLDPSRTVGWFTSVYPVVLAGAGLDDPAALVTGVRDLLRSVPRGGVGFGALRELTPGDGDELRSLREQPNPAVLFNYSGGFDAVLDDAVTLITANLPGELNGLIMTERQARPHVLQIEAARTSDGRMVFEWVYSTELHRPETIRRVAEEHLTALRWLIARCQQEAAR